VLAAQARYSECAVLLLVLLLLLLQCCTGHGREGVVICRWHGGSVKAWCLLGAAPAAWSGW
jgi:hypothetical protein